LGPGFLGLVVASLIAAYMSTIGTHLNWGSSYAVNDFYARFIRKNASQKELIGVARIMTVVLMVIAGTFSLTFLENAGQAFKFMLLSGAGTGAIYLLRWFWYRVNAWTEIAGMLGASIVAIWLIAGPGDEGTKRWIVDYKSVQEFVHVVDDATLVAAAEAGDDVLTQLSGEDFSTFMIDEGEERSVSTMVKNNKLYVYDARVDGLVFPVQLLICVGFVTLAWLLTTLLTPPAETSVLRSFYKLCHPGGPGWKKVVLDARADGEEIDQKEGITDWKLPIQLLCVFLGCVAIYCSLFAVGNFIYGNMVSGVIMALVAAASTFVLFKSFGKLGAE
jgi:SSS family solute:Na+ symporter